MNDILIMMIETAAAALLLGVAFCIMVFLCERVERAYRRHKRRIFRNRRRRRERGRELRKRDEDFQYKLIRRTWLLEDELIEISKPKPRVTIRGIFDTPEGNRYMDSVMEKRRF